MTVHIGTILDSSLTNLDFLLATERYRVVVGRVQVRGMVSDPHLLVVNLSICCDSMKKTGRWG